jgi:hypothetical protein
MKPSAIPEEKTHEHLCIETILFNLLMRKNDFFHYNISLEWKRLIYSVSI